MSWETIEKDPKIESIIHSVSVGDREAEKRISEPNIAVSGGSPAMSPR